MSEYLESIGGTVDEYTEAAAYYDALEEEKMERYIDAGALLSYLDIEREKEKCDFTKDFYSGVEFVCYEIEEFPRADVAPVIHAHWETDNYGYAILNEEGHTMYLAGVPCSRCHVTGHTNWNYCPNCGAKMDEVM